ncbi:hypothetical protein P691DRAFT_683477, partial [Macrolepiota fuliginosa MF-IS2]
MARPPLVLRGHEVKTAEVYKYLGVHIDSELRWKIQEERVVAKATKWVLMFKRLADEMAVPWGGHTQDDIRTGHLVQPPNTQRGGEEEDWIIQRIAALAITGGLHTMPNDLLDAHMGLTPLQLSLDKICHRNTTRICTIPGTNPLTHIARRCVTRPSKKHLSNLQVLLEQYGLNPATIEIICPPAFTSADPLPLGTSIAETREDPMREEQMDNSRYKIYSDGSGQDGRVGVAAILLEEGNLRPTKTLQFHLGTTAEHTTYEAEAVGALLAM